MGTEVRLGALLIDAGVLTDQQVQEIVARQQATQRPFGLLAEQMYGVDPVAVEEAWASQYATLTRTVDLQVETFEPRAQELVSRRQAWQFRVLPIRFDDDELMLATTPPFVRRALGFATRVMAVPTYLVIAPPLDLGDALCRHYPLAGMTPQSITDDSLGRLLGTIAPRRRAA